MEQKMLNKQEVRKVRIFSDLTGSEEHSFPSDCYKLIFPSLVCFFSVTAISECSLPLSQPMSLSFFFLSLVHLRRGVTEQLEQPPAVQPRANHHKRIGTSRYLLLDDYYPKMAMRISKK